MAKQKPSGFTWNAKRLKAAELIAAGEMTHADVAKACSVNRSTVSEWHMHEEFKEKVREFVLLDERATKAGIVQRALKTLKDKSSDAKMDKSTELDYLKFIAKIQGHEVERSQVEHSGGVSINLKLEDCSEKGE